MTTLERPVRPRRVHYPESDGKPMGETDLHRDLMTDLIFALKWFLRSTQAYVAGNLFIYYEEGNPRAVVAPDVFVALGVEQRRRRIFQTWREGGRAPDVVIEITSKKTRKTTASGSRRSMRRWECGSISSSTRTGSILSRRCRGIGWCRGCMNR